LEEKNMKKMFIILGVLLGLTQIVAAADYRYVSDENLKGWLEAAKPVLLVDIQEMKDFAAHHIKGSLETNAYPVKSTEERQRLQPALQSGLTPDFEAVVVVCPRGKGGAKRAYEYLLENGIPESKLSILTGGMGGWPYPEWVETK